MLSDLLMWNKIGRIATCISQKLGITPLQALDMFYSSPVCDQLHSEATGLYMMSDGYIADEVVLNKLANREDKLDSTMSLLSLKGAVECNADYDSLRYDHVAEKYHL